MQLSNSSYDYSASNHLVGGDRSTYAYDGRGIRTITSVPVGLATLAVNPVSAVGGTKLAGTVTLDGPARSVLVAGRSNPAYGPSPGKPGYGTIIEVVGCAALT